MTLRAWLIRHHGAVPGDDVLDPDDVVRWFFARLEVPLLKVLRLVDGWPELPVDQIRQLRHIKNRLDVIQSLAGVPGLAPDADMAAWLGLRDRLP